MKVVSRLYMGVGACLFALLLHSGCENIPQKSAEEHFEVPVGERYQKPSKRDRVDLAQAQEVEMTRDPATGEVPTERLLEAKAYADQLRYMHAAQRAPLPLVEWTERGPDNVGGRTRTMMVDPNDPTGLTVFSAGVAGGVWKTTDISAAEPNWVPVDDFLDNLAVTTMAADPNNPQIMYFGTGEGYSNLDAVPGLGIWKSTDGGNNWSQLAATNNNNFTYNQRMQVTPTGTVLAATRNGLFRSTNGGTSWSKVLGTGLGITGAGSNRCWDVQVAANGDVYASLEGSIHKSSNDGATFGAAMTMPITVSRSDLACAPSDANYVYALVEAGNQVNGIIRTTDGGNTWTTRNEPADADGGIPNTDFSRGQAWYDLAIAVAPTDRNRVFVGGVDLFGSGDGGNSWTQIAHWYGGFGFQYVHADQHYIAFDPGNANIAYFCNDGGIYRSTNAGAASPTITQKVRNYNVTQFYGCDIHPDAGVNLFLAGAQDNGTQKFTQAGMNSTVEATGGDGAFCNIDQNEPQFMWTQYVYNNFRRSTNGGNSFVNVNAGNTGRFINPSDYDDQGNRMYSARGTDQYLRWNDPQSGNSFTTVNFATLGGQVSAIKVSPNTANRVFFGTGNGNVVRADNANGTPTGSVISGGGMPAAYVSCIEVENGNDNHILVSFSNFGVNSIWETTDGGSNWTSVEGNLPDIPVRWILLNPDNASEAIIATQLGVWSTDNLNGGSTVWGPSNSGLANVRVDMLKMRDSDKLVIAATHGRGLFSSDVFSDPTAEFDSDRHVIYTGRSVQFQDASLKATSWDWNFGDGNTSTLENPQHTYAAPGRYTVSLSINGGVDVETKTAFIHVLPNRGTPYAPADGGDFELLPDEFGVEAWAGTAFERGVSAVGGKNGTRSGSNAFVTGLAAANYADNSHSELYGPNHNFTASGVYTLSFWGRFNTETSWDGFRVEYSLDKGMTWQLLGATGANWYNTANTTQNTAFPINEPYFSGNQGGAYAEYIQDVSFLQGNPNVAFRFVFRTDAFVTSPGVAVDDYSITGPLNNAGGLPVTAAPLQGAWEGQDAVLSWETFQEQNNLGFAIERSADGVQFDEIAFVPGKGDTDAGHRYGYTDLGPAGTTVFYRYRQQDLDGAWSLSNQVELSRLVSELEVTAYPNPTSGPLQVRVQGLGQEAWNWSLYSASGQLVATGSGKGDGSLDLSKTASGLTAGRYFFSLQAGRLKRSFQIQILQ